MPKESESRAGGLIYNKEFHETIIRLLQDTDLTIKEITKRCGIGQQTFYDWKKRYPKFAEDVVQARKIHLGHIGQMAQQEVERRIKGYTVEEETTIMVRGRNGKAKIREVRSVKKHIKASDALLEKILINRLPDDWKDRSRIEHSGSINTQHDFSDATPDEIRQYLKDQREAEELLKRTNDQ